MSNILTLHENESVRTTISEVVRNIIGNCEVFISDISNSELTLHLDSGHINVTRENIYAIEVALELTLDSILFSKGNLYLYFSEQCI